MAIVLGTGLSGLVGSRVVELTKNHTFVDASLETKIDILDLTQLEGFFEAHPEADTVLHMAAFTDAGAAWSERGDKAGKCWRTNVEGTQNILALCHKYSKYLIHISTDYVFNGTKDQPYVEADTPKPLDWYGESKYEAEMLITKSKQHAAIVRIAYPYRVAFPNKIDLVRRFLGKLQQGESISLFEDQITTPTLIDDIAIGLNKIIEMRPTSIFHLVASSYQSVYELGLDIAKVFELDNDLIKPSSLKEYLKTPGVRPFSINGAVSNESTKKILGIEPRDCISGLTELKRQIEQKA